MPARAVSCSARTTTVVKLPAKSSSHLVGKACSPKSNTYWDLNRRISRRSVIAAGFGEQLLDYIEGGPKLRKWYGQGERPTDGGGFPGKTDSEPDQAPPEDIIRDSVLVTDADSPMGQAVLLQLILARQKVRALVRSADVTSKEYGAYVVPVSGDVSKAPEVAQALVGAETVIVTGRIGPHLLAAAQKAGVTHIMLPSLAGGKAGPFAFMGPDSVLRDVQRETQAMATDIPVTVVRAAAVTDRPGGDCGLGFTVTDKSSGNESSRTGNNTDISREDLAKVIVGALAFPPAKSFILTVLPTGPGGSDDWQEALGIALKA